jgi:hypothetical protein
MGMNVLEKHSMNFNQLTTIGFIGKNAETNRFSKGSPVTKLSRLPRHAAGKTIRASGKTERNGTPFCLRAGALLNWLPALAPTHQQPGIKGEHKPECEAAASALFF